MLKILLISLTFIPCLIFAQSKWKVGLTISPDICYRSMHFKSTEYQEHYDSIYTYKARLGFRFGITTIYNYSENLELEFGLLHSQENLLRNNPVNDSLIDHISLLSNTRYLLIPIKANILMGEEDLAFIGTAGLSFGYGYRLRMKYTPYDSTNTELGHSEFKDGYYPDFMVCAELGAGMRYSFDDKLELRILPTFRYMINSGYKGSPFKFTPFTVGLSCSVLWRI